VASIDDFTMSRHAIQRAVDMALNSHEIKRTLLSPNFIVDSNSYPGCQNYVGDRIVASVATDRKIVTTIVWRGHHGELERDSELDINLARNITTEE
jgi:hypothetical protein